MSFGGFGGGFGAPSSSPFGTTSPSPFGQQAPAFGQNTSPFGAATTPGVFGQSAPAFGVSPAPAFGASPAPAFGAASTPAFGAASTPAFGAVPTSAFGSKPAFGGFGASAASPFGAGGASTPAFGAASAPAFGASLFGGGATAFGASSPAFGAASSPAFGAASSPAFGATSAPAFGQPLSAFGSTAFGGAAPVTGGFGSPGFGSGARGTRAVAWRKTQEQDTSGSSGGAKSVVFFNSISCMPEYAGKSVDELRWQDYQDGCKGNPGATSPAGGAFGVTAFGATASSPFGASASTPAFGTSAPAFGGASTPAFGAFGGTSAAAFGAAASAPAFGGFGAGAAQPFGVAAPSPFGQSASAFGAASMPAFGATSSPAFGAASAPAFGAPSSAPAFGGFGAASVPAFGAASTPAFGAAGTTSYGFGAASTPAFGAAPAPAFGAASSPAFGFGAASTPGFGAASAPAFGPSSTSLFGPASAPAFGSTSLFGATQQKPAGGFGFGGASTPTFGASPAPVFGASSATPYGAASVPAFGTSLFGTGQAAPSFGFAPAQPAAMPFGAMGPAQPIQAPGVATSPYGVLPEPPRVSPAPEYKVGLTQRPAGLLAGGPARPAALITPRSITPRSGVRMRPRHGMSATRMSKSPADFLLAATAQAGGTPGSTAPGGANGGIFVPRENPRRLLVRDALPSTEAAGTTTASPAIGGTPGGMAALRTPGSSLRITPGRRTDGGASGSGAGTAAGAENGGDFVLAENGFRPHGSGGGGLSDAELASLLPSLKQPDYYTEPSLQQLAAMARDDPTSLATISNFCVGRRGVGAVRWLEATDVRGLDLDATMQLSKGSIEVYLDEGTKPEVGRGLNKPAEVTMLRIHRLDKESGKPTTDPEAIDRFVRKLKKLTAEQGARFVSYDATSGTWKFEVEHFSKYGLLDSDKEGSDDELVAYGVRGRAAVASQARQAAAGQQRQRQEDGGDEEGDEEEARLAMEEAAALEEEVLDDEEAMQESQGRGGGGSVAAGEGEAEMEEADGEEEVTLGGGPPGGLNDREGRALQLSLPAQMGMEPEDLQRIRDGLYAGNQYHRQPPAKHRHNVVVGGSGAAQQPAVATVPPLGPVFAALAKPSLAARNAWRNQQATALRPPSAAKTAAPRTPALGAAPLLPAGPSPMRDVATGKQCLVPAPGPTRAQQRWERCLPDAGLFAGTAFRTGWAPNAVFAHAGGRDSSAAHVVVRQLAVGARVAPAGKPAGTDSAFQKRQRGMLEAALKLHIQRSSPDPLPSAGDNGDEAMATDGEQEAVAAAGGGVPRWRLRCQRHEELRQLTRQYIDLCTAAAAEARGVERTVLCHQATTWELLHVLFSAIAGEQAMRGSSGQGGEQTAAMDADDVRLDRLVAFKRRAGMSRWLRDRARPHVEAALRASGGGGAGGTASDAIAAQLLALLSGHQLAAAAALAAATGNVRLATLLAQGGTKAVGQAELGEQLRVWEESGCERHISATLRRVYQLLAGQVDGVTPAMGLDWCRALGLHLWYGCQPTATVSDALASYTAAVEAGSTPPPLPPYAKQGGGASACAGSFDVSFELLRLHAVASDPDSSGSATALQPLLARLLRPSGFTPDPLDYTFCWHLLGVLEAVGTVPAAAARLPEAAAARMSFISQLEATRQLSHWAIYVALHIPEATERNRVVRELLMSHAAEWCDDKEVLAFFRNRLHLPVAWLSEAQALWAHYCQNDADRLDYLLAAGDWPVAHALLCDVMAPRWLLGGTTERLSRVLQQLEPHSQAINLAGGTGSWEAGGGCYSSYLFLRQLYTSLGRSSRAAQQSVPLPALSFRERMEAAARLADMLQDAAARWGLAGAEQGTERRLDARRDGGAAQQAVYARMSAELSKWVLSDSEGCSLLPLPEQDRLAVGLHAMPHETAAEGLQMAAVNLAQRVS